MKTRKQMAKCQLGITTKRYKQCERCASRFVCLSQRFEFDDVSLPFWMFAVPNNQEGLLFLQMAKKFFNADAFQMKKRGRAVDRHKKSGGQSFQPLNSADWIALYIYKSPLAMKVWTGDPLATKR